jgi:hypothetical protein
VARNEDIVNSIWDDLDDLSNDEMLLFVWSWTNKKCGMSGLYKCARRNLVEGRLEADALNAALSDLSRRRLLFYEDGVVWNRPRFKRLRQKGEKIAAAVATDLKDIAATHPLRVAWMQEYIDDAEHGPKLRAALGDKGVVVYKGFTIHVLPSGASHSPSDSPSIPHPAPDAEPNPDTPSIALRRAPGLGQGIGAVVDQVLARLGECAKWKRPPESDRELIERVVLDTPSADHLAAATSAVAKGGDPKWRTRTPGLTFKYAVEQQLSYEQPKAEADKPDPFAKYATGKESRA